MFLTFTEKPVSVFTNAIIITSNPITFYMLIESLSELSLIFATFFSDVVSFSASVINSYRFPFLFALRVLFLNCFIADPDSNFSNFIKNEPIESPVSSAIQNLHSTISEFT